MTFKLVLTALVTAGLWISILVAVRGERREVVPVGFTVAIGEAVPVGFAVAIGEAVPMRENLLLSKNICVYHLLLNSISRVIVGL
jgi:hypothetical protein